MKWQSGSDLERQRVWREPFRSLPLASADDKIMLQGENFSLHRNCRKPSVGMAVDGSNTKDRNYLATRGMAYKCRLQPRDACSPASKGTRCQSLFPLFLFLLLCAVSPRHASAGYTLLAETNGKSGSCLDPVGEKAPKLPHEFPLLGHCCGYAFSLPEIFIDGLSEGCCGTDVDVVCKPMCDLNSLCTGVYFKGDKCDLLSGTIVESDGKNFPAVESCWLRTRYVYLPGHVVMVDVIRHYSWRLVACVPRGH